MVLEVQFPIASLHLPRVFHFLILDLQLQPVTVLEIRVFGDNKALGRGQRAQREAITKVIRHLPINLARHDTSCVTNGLLHSDGGGTSVVRGNVDVQPGHVKTRASVDSYGAKECTEEFNGVVSDRYKEDISDNTKDIGDKDALKADSVLA